MLHFFEVGLHIYTYASCIIRYTRTTRSILPGTMVLTILHDMQAAVLVTTVNHVNDFVPLTLSKVSISPRCIINSRRACAAGVTVYSRSVCLSVSNYFRTTGYEAAYERYQQLQCYKGKKNNVAILLTCCECVREIWRENKGVRSQYAY